MTLSNAIKWNDIFTDTSSESVIKKRYHELAKIYHSDNLQSGDADLFKKLTIYYDMALSYIGINVNSMKIQKITFKSNKGSIDFEYKANYSVGGCNVYYSDTEIAIIFPKNMYDLADRFERLAGRIEIPGSGDESKTLKMCMPEIKQRLNGLIILKKTKEVVNLGELVDLANKGKIVWENRDRHATWIVNRLYLLWCIMKYNNKVFMGFDIYDMFISPKYHSVLPLLGWQFMVDDNTKMVGTTGSIIDIMDSTTIANKTAKTYVDGDSIKLIARKVFGNTSWKELDSFLNEASSENPEDDWNRFTNIFMKKFGARKYYELKLNYEEFYSRK